ncbi:MAG TPA: hypothetical protein VKT75_06815 [Acidobacteriaceae bacterium]|nr:hypothetical protein [Acidobacteriaceae bacterium]
MSRWSFLAIPAVVMALAFGAQQPAHRIDARRAPSTRPQVPELLYTAALVYDLSAALHGAERFPRGAQIMILRDGHATPLVSSLAASADPSLSFDGKTVLFAGKQNADDPWQIWSMALDGSEPRRVLIASTDLIRPLWMPDRRIVYARRTPEGFALETAGLDGASVQRLSFLPGNFIPDDVLRDGRVLFESGFPLGAGSVPELYLVYADGSGVESVRCDHEAADRQHGRQLQSSDIVFTRGGSLARFTSALAEEAPVAGPAGDFAGDVAELPDSRWVVSLRLHGTRHYALHIVKPGAPATMLLVRDADRDLVEPVLIAPRPAPNRHPSALHEWTTGNLLALNAQLSRGGNLKTAPASVGAETLDSKGGVVDLGTAPIETDGSFFVQAAGDRPLRFILLDAQGHTLRKEQGWFWVRRGEQRICVGCHTGPERAPDNRVPQVLLRTTTPVALTGSSGSPATGGR